MKKYSYKFTAINIVLFCIGLIVAALCIVMNVNRIIELSASPVSGSYDYISAILAIVIGASGIVVIIPAIVSSKYVIQNDKLITKWGFIKSQVKIADITRITLYRATQKLVISYNSGDYAVINIESALFDDFCDNLKIINSKIFYCIDTENSGEK